MPQKKQGADPKTAPLTLITITTNKASDEQKYRDYLESRLRDIRDVFAHFVDQQCKWDLIQLARQRGMQGIDYFLEHACGSNAVQLKVANDILDGTIQSRVMRIKFLGRFFYLQPRLDFTYNLAKFYLHQQRCHYVSPPDTAGKPRLH